jgi:hypothetical protein
MLSREKKRKIGMGKKSASGGGDKPSLRSVKKAAALLFRQIGF